jgi:hypothetical protein
MFESFLASLASAFQMDQGTWERHANPWSVWTRIASWPLVMLALWSIHWIGWWALVPLGLLAVWLWLNPRVFPPPPTTRSWAARAVMGERVYLLRATLHPVPVYHANAATLLSIGSAVGALAMLAGLIAAEPGVFVAGGIATMLCKLWFADRMVWLFDDMAREVEEYRAWLR